MISKKLFLRASLLLAALLIGWDYIGNYRICDSIATDGSLGNCPNFLSGIETILLLSIPLFIFSLITYFMREEVFRAWVRFAVPAIVISMLLIAITPEYGGGGFGPQLSFGKGDVAFLTSLIFAIVSFIIILAKYLSLRKR